MTQKLQPINLSCLNATYLQITFFLFGHRDKGKDEQSFLTSLQDSFQNKQFCNKSLSSTGRSWGKKKKKKKKLSFLKLIFEVKKKKKIQGTSIIKLA